MIATARAFGRERTDEIGIRTMRLVNLLEQGSTIPAAFADSRLPISTDLRMAIDSGLGNAYLNQIIADAVSNPGIDLGDTSGHSMLHRFFYLTGVVFFGAMTWVFSIVKLIPTYNQIFTDFELSLTPVTYQVVQFADSRWSVLVTVVLFIMSACVLLLSIPVTFYYIGWLKWEPPPLRRITAKYHGAVVLRGLAAAVERNETIPDALEHIGVAYPVNYVRQKIARATETVQGGAEWIASLKQEQLIEPAAAAVLRSAERVGNLPWALREMSGSLLRNLTYRTSAVMQIVTIAVLVLVSIPVGLFAFAMFAPIPNLIEALL